MESPLENRVHLRKWNFTIKGQFLPITPANVYNYHPKQISDKKRP